MENLVKVNSRKDTIEDIVKSFDAKWINLLTGNDVNKKREFEEVLAKSKCVGLAIMKYRRMLMAENNVIVQDPRWLNCVDEIELKSCLEQIFLEPVEFSHIEYFYNVAIKKYENVGLAFEKLIDFHMKDRGLRFLSVTLLI